MAARRRSCSLEVASFALTLNFSEAPKVLRARFVARTGPLGLDFGSPGRPRTRFWRPKRLDFRLFSACLCVSCQFRSNPTKHGKNWYARHMGAFARQDKSDRKSIRGHVRSRSVQRWRSDGSLGGSWKLERLRGSPGTLLDGSWPLLARPGCPKIGLEAAFGCPMAVPSASGRVPETASGSQNASRSIFRRFSVD